MGELSGDDEPMEDFDSGEEAAEDDVDKKYVLTPVGEEALEVVWAIDCWLAKAPGGRVSLTEEEEAGVLMEVFLDGWRSGIIGALAPGPLTLTELGLACDTLSRGSLRRKVRKLRGAGLIEARPDGGEGTAYAVTDWLREAIGPFALGARCELRRMEDRTGPSSPSGFETAFLLALPLLELPAGVSGHCRLLVDLPESEERRAAGAMIRVESGRVASCGVDLEGSADSWAIGLPPAWLDAVIDGDADRLEFGGEGRLARAVVEGLHTRLTDGPLGRA